MIFSFESSDVLSVKTFTPSRKTVTLSEISNIYATDEDGEEIDIEEIYGDDFLDYWNEVDKCNNQDLEKIISKYTSNNFHMRCTHPFNELNGVEKVSNQLWVPIKESFKPIQRRLDIFYAGENSLDENGGVWISSMGHLMGEFNKSFFGLQPHYKSSLLRFAEFYKVEDNKITEGAIFLDIFNFMQQLGLSIIPESTGLVLSLIHI